MHPIIVKKDQVGWSTKCLDGSIVSSLSPDSEIREAEDIENRK